jgi:nitroimidazol reductase NimA-like FMN-containing flavoprotein (pyridoxamine 5'-phosphate oxidase superfamily)
VSQADPADAADSSGRPRTQVRRAPEKQVDDRAALYALLDIALIGHLAVVTDGWPYVVPVAVARDGDRVLCHGSTGARLFRGLADGEPTCLTVTIVDGLVLARSQFESSMHYRSAMVLGRCTELKGKERFDAFEVLTEHLMPSRGADSRGATKKEAAQTSVLALPIDEWSLKVSDGQPDDPDEDVALPYWAGTLPLHHVWGTPRAADNLPDGVPVPSYLASWPDGRT